MTDMMNDTLPARRTCARGDDAFARLAQAAAARGLTLLDTQWLGARHPYRFRCAQGHDFTRIAPVMIRGTATCRQCEQDEVQRRFLDTLQQRGFVCDKAGFPGQKTRCRFTCRHGHTWETEARKIMDGHGCLTCKNTAAAAKNTRADGLERMQRIAAGHGGRCLAENYLGTLARYEWECADGHRWQAPAAAIVRGRWCRTCSARRHSRLLIDPNGLARLQATAASRGGQCLADGYAGVNASYQFRCAKGHEWRTSGSHIMNGSWCAHCIHEDQKNTLARMQEVARARGGRCLSDEYQGLSVRLTWECHRGHVWNARPRNVIYRGAWCTDCAILQRTKKRWKRKRYDVDC